jgi:hypothetical protein
VADQGSRFVLVLEDLNADGDLRLFTNPDMIAGTSVEQAKRCLSAFAPLHASFHGLDAEERASILPPDLHPFCSPTARALSPVLGKASIGPCHRKAPDLFPDDMVELVINSLQQDVLAAHERELIDHYVAELARHGVTLAWDEAWAQYRAYSFQTLLTSVVSLGLGTMTDMDEVLAVILERSVAAIRRTGFGDWLDGELAPASKP